MKVEPKTDRCVGVRASSLEPGQCFRLANPVAHTIYYRVGVGAGVHIGSGHSGRGARSDDSRVLAVCLINNTLYWLGGDSLVHPCEVEAREV